MDITANLYSALAVLPPCAFLAFLKKHSHNPLVNFSSQLVDILCCEGRLIVTGVAPSVAMGHFRCDQSP
jgi:hypothetical protein